MGLSGWDWATDRIKSPLEMVSRSWATEKEKKTSKAAAPRTLAAKTGRQALYLGIILSEIMAVSGRPLL